MFATDLRSASFTTILLCGPPCGISVLRPLLLKSAKSYMSSTGGHKCGKLGQSHVQQGTPVGRLGGDQLWLRVLFWVWDRRGNTTILIATRGPSIG
jgi:hypothetical protein